MQLQQQRREHAPKDEHIDFFLRVRRASVDDEGRVILLLPIFFAYTGLRTQIGLLNNGELWLDTALIIIVACLGKFGGSTLAGRACGLGWSEASTVGILMNTRGLMELVVLQVGLDAGVIGNAMFTLLLVMGIATTLMATPLMRLCLRGVQGAERVPAGSTTANATPNP